MKFQTIKSNIISHFFSLSRKKEVEKGNDTENAKNHLFQLDRTFVWACLHNSSSWIRLDANMLWISFCLSYSMPCPPHKMYTTFHVFIRFRDNFNLELQSLLVFTRAAKAKERKRQTWMKQICMPFSYLFVTFQNTVNAQISAEMFESIKS